MLPLLIGGAAALQGLGSIFGANAANDASREAGRAYEQNINKGIGTLQQGKGASDTAFQPYANAGQIGADAELAAIRGRQQAALPTLSNASPAQAMSYLNPSAAYTQDQARKAAQAQGIAGGALGGGFLKALSNNANKMAMTNYNDAYNQMLQTGAQNFGQGQQNYQNINDYQQQQIQNYGGLANRGLQAAGANQGIQQGYNTGIANQYEQLGSGLAGLANKRGETSQNMWTGLGNIAGNALPGLFGGGK